MTIGIISSGIKNGTPSDNEKNNALSDDYQSLKKIHEVLSRHGEISSREKQLHVEWYNRIINSDVVMLKIRSEPEKHHNFILMSDSITGIINGENNGNKCHLYMNTESEHFFPLYTDLEKTCSVLNSKKTTENQALDEIKHFQKIADEYRGMNAETSDGKMLLNTIQDVSGDIDEYLMKRDMISFGYFSDRMNIASKYSYNINVKYYRDGMQRYTKFYEELAKKLSSYGEYMDGTEDDGKKIRIKQHRFYQDLQDIFSDYFPVNGNIENSKGERCSLYKGKFEIVIGKDKSDCSIYIDNTLIDTGVSYDDAYKKMTFFLSSYKRAATGTQIIKKITTDENKLTGKPEKITVTADVVAHPGALLRWIEIDFDTDHISEINRLSENSMSLLEDFDSINCHEINKNNKDEEAEITRVYNKAMNNSYMNKNKEHVNAIRVEMNSKLNSYNTIIDGIKKELQMTLDEYSQRYNTINSNYDNMLRTITTMINELTQELKGFLRF